jgi:hypothetical protein
VLEVAQVVAVEVGGLVVERVVRVGLIEEINEPVDHGVDVEHGLPVLAQDVQADVALRAARNVRRRRPPPIRHITHLSVSRPPFG